VSQIQIHTHTAGEGGLLVNAYLVEVAAGLVAVDTGLLNSDIAALDSRVEALGKPLLAVFVSHAHPDHFNGTHALVKDRAVPVYATAAVAAAIHEVADAKREQWGPVYGAEWPTRTTYPTHELADGAEVNIEGLSISVRDVGAAESHADSYLVARQPGCEPVAFVGDLAFAGTHPYTADGHTGRWLTVLDRLAAELARVPRLLPGHGGPTTPAVIADQRRYLMFYREVVRRLLDGRSELDEAARAELDRQMQAFLPGAPLSWMVRLGADAVSAEIVAEGDGARAA